MEESLTNSFIDCMYLGRGRVMYEVTVSLKSECHGWLKKVRKLISIEVQYKINTVTKEEKKRQKRKD